VFSLSQDWASNRFAVLSAEFRLQFRMRLKTPFAVRLLCTARFLFAAMFVLGLCAAPPAMAQQQEHWDTLNTRFSNLYVREKYAEALPIAEESLEMAKHDFGPADYRVAISLQNLAFLRSAQDDFAGAEPLAQRALSILKAETPPDQRRIAMALNTLSQVYQHAGKFPEAETDILQAIDIQKKVLPANDADLGVTLAALASLYQVQFKYAEYGEMEANYKRAISILEKAHGPKDPYLATVLGNFARVYTMSGRSAKAVPLFEREIVVKEVILGPDNPDLFTELCLLAAAQNQAKQYAAAEQTYQRILQTAKTMKRSDRSLQVSGFYEVLSSVLHLQGKDAQAEESAILAVQTIENDEGALDPDIIAPLGSLARLYRDEKKYLQAEETYKRLLAVDEKDEKPQSVRIVMTMDELISTMEAQGKFVEAEQYYLRRIDFWDKSTVPDAGIAARERYVEMLRKLGREPEAEAVENKIKEMRLAQQVANMKDSDITAMQRSLVSMEAMALSQGFGPEYTKVSDSLMDYASVLRLKGRAEESKAVEARAKSMCEHRDYAGPESFGEWFVGYLDAADGMQAKRWNSARAIDQLDLCIASLRKVNRPSDAAILEKRAALIRSKTGAEQ
jgi:tetratricopeptide (TPR) repeat protein